MPRLDDHHSRLRAEVVRLRASASRRVRDLTVHVGTLGRSSVSYAVSAPDLALVDGPLRTEVLATLLEQSPQGEDMLWIWRPGVPSLHDLDLGWLSAAALAFGAFGRDPLSCHAITWTGWLDIRTGENRVWKRLRV